MNEDILRDALTARAERVEVAPDALPRIRQKIARRRARRLLPPLAAFVATTAAVVVTVVSCLPAREPDPNPVGTASERTSQTTAPPSTAPASTPGSVRAAAIPVYYAAGNRLFREYHSLPLPSESAAQRVTAAVTEMLRDGSPADPDYRTLWPSTARVLRVEADGGPVTVDLGGVGAPAGGVEPGEQSARLAVQQLVWTVAAAVVGTPASPFDGLRLTLDGRPATTLWGVDVRGALRQSPQTEVLAPVWLIEPHHGATVGRTFAVHIAGTVFEATVQLRVRNAAGAVVTTRTLTLSIGAPNRGEVRTMLTLAPGRYTIEAYFESPEDGSEQGRDDHSITVG